MGGLGIVGVGWASSVLVGCSPAFFQLMNCEREDFPMRGEERVDGNCLSVISPYLR
jgi:hypothetical protein